jgi:carbonic anhydrase
MKRNLLLFGVGIVVCSALAGYMFAQIQPVQQQGPGSASALVLACIDPRFTASLAWYLTHNKQAISDYDLIALAGASLGVLQTTYGSWQTTFLDHVKLALQLHNIKEIWAFDHLDCGMYKATLDLKDDMDKSIHIEKLQELKAFLAREFPQLGFKGFIIDVRGNIEKVVE